MRIVTWNCRVGAFQRKAERVAAWQPDILVVQEVENLDSALLFAGHEQPTFRHRASDPAFPLRSTGVFSYTGTQIQSVDEQAAPFGFNRYEVRFGDLHFNLAAVWTWATKVEADSYRQVHKGLERYDEWVRQRETVMLGDFNSNKAFRGKRWEDLEKLLDSLGFVSVYHATSGEPFGAEKRHTHFHLGHAESAFHIDYCFVPKAWESRITNVEVPPAPSPFRQQLYKAVAPRRGWRWISIQTALCHLAHLIPST